eukprot:TRINITY_DN2608_c0_g1_i1.p1 TRINITY_DN2608_c0_g1~~TRINITY_DN2608_c0_g1_i1.p1  ORF type:complete len:999 (-),score=164.74 TRINITY_DN2608_c0_g1_i1:4-2868(-)
MESTPTHNWPSAKVRSTFIEFFKSKEHLFVPSSSVVPHEDPTLLFTNAGMNQFKPIFLGQVDPRSDQATWKRAANSQKCIRAGGKHNDLDDVGKDTYHHTFFEMLGNWSFGNYFKEEAIGWAWELLTEVYGLEKDRLYVTYFKGDEKDGLEADEEARQIWLRYLPTERVLPFGRKENFWEMGDTGPCGPCSEIHYDRIGGRNAAERVNCEPGDPLVIEIWNLVFIQYNREESGKLRSLPAKHVDTGMGFERLTSILQKVHSNYDTDIFAPIFKAIQEITGAPVAYSGKVGEEDTGNVDMAYRVVADHIRTLSFAINDGALPGATDRNYVVRRICRRAVRFGKQILGAKGNFFYKLVPTLVAALGDAFPELHKDPKHLQDILLEEEVSFNKTLDKGIIKFDRLVAKLKPGDVIPGKSVFKLFDTFGFPVDLTTLMAEEKGLKVDLEGFKKAVEEAKDESRKKGKKNVSSKFVLSTHAVAELQGKGVAPTEDAHKYNNGDIEAVVKALWDGEAYVDSVSAGAAGVVLDQTNFYAEQGGQIYDLGTIKTCSGDNSVQVQGVQLYGGFVLHVGAVSGTIKVGDKVSVSIDAERRRPIAANHTATHLLNFALRSKLGGNVDQKGSLVQHDKLRFDFSWNKPMTREQLHDVDALVAEAIAKNLPVSWKEIPLEQAREIEGLRAVFGETYPNPVRVICVGPHIDEVLKNPKNADWRNYSIELCGGTHLTTLADALSFTVISEEALAQGVRRVVAYTGNPALAAVQNAEAFEQKLKAVTDLKGNELRDSIARLTIELDAPMPATRKLVFKDELEKLRDRLRKESTGNKAEQAAAAQRYGAEIGESVTNQSSSFYVGQVELGSSNVAITSTIKAIREKRDIPVLLVSADTSKAKPSITIVAQVPDALVSKLKANEWASTVAVILGGKAGGKPNLAQGAGSNVARVNEALDAASRFITQKLDPQ